MTLKFGTDGVRGRAYDELTVDFVEALTRVAARELGASAMVIGADGRESGPAYVDAVARGCAAADVEAWTLGVVPTPAVAHVAATHAVAGAMISASHNPFHDNGVKFFSPGGRKLSDATQEAIEKALAEENGQSAPVGAQGRPIDRRALVAEWSDALERSLDGRSLAGLEVVADTANGAACEHAPAILRRLGATVTTINDEPNGRNINLAAGSTHPQGLQEAVVRRGAHLGVAFDGDADRLVAVDHLGHLVDGDHIIAIAAIDMHQRGLLVDDTVVITVMTNLGFRLSMRERGIAVHETPVGDRYVLEALEMHGWSLGGEQSGHVVFPRHATTGDGILTALQLLDVVSRTGTTLHDLSAAAMTRLPQVLENVRVSGRAGDLVPELASDIEAIEAELGSSGRVLVRPSGTEPLLRIMVEAPSEREARAAGDRLAAAAKALAGA